MIDRRRFPRFDCAFNVRYATQGVVSLEGSSIARNLSRRGICLPLYRLAKTGNPIRLEIEPKDRRGIISAIGRIVWTRPAPHHSPYEIDAGIEFQSIGDPEIDRLLRTVY